MFENILKIANHKPKLYEKSTANFWDDPHISKYMLKAHLDKDWDAATRNHAFVDKSVDWIASILPPTEYKNLIDFGCGPGLYAERFYNKSYNVTGVDLSPRSIEYAKANATKNNHNIEYINQNYLDFVPKHKYDVATLIYCDFGVLSTDDRSKLLDIIYDGLRPGGALVFDSFTPNEHEGKKETKSWQYCETGFYNEKPHICLHSFYRYDEDSTVLTQCIAITEDKVNCYNIWEHTFTSEELKRDLTKAGYSSVELYGDIAGAKYDENGKTICVVARK